MFDTIGFRYITNEALKWQNLENIKETLEHNTGRVFLSGRIKNLFVKEVDSGIMLYGSLPKYYFGNNLEVLTRKNSQEAIEKLSDELSIKIENSEIYRVDVSNNLIMQENSKNYLLCLDNMNKFKKSTFEKSIYYTSNSTEMIFYDKTAEMRNKRQEIPEDFRKYENKILRYELRFKRNFKGIFGKQVLMKDLTDEVFYIGLINKWQEYYFKINKKNKMKFNQMALKDVKQFKTQLMLIGLKTLGYNGALEMIELSRNELDYYQISRIKKQIQKLSQTKELTEPNSLMNELDSKIRQAVKYYR